MTPQQQRLLHPLTRQTPVRQVANLVAALSLSWPFSIARTWCLTYCATVSAVLDPICLHAACGSEDRGRRAPRS